MTSARPDTRFLGITLAAAAPAKYMTFRANNSTWIDDTVDAGDPGTNDTILGITSAGAGVGDIRYYGSSTPFDSIDIDVFTAMISTQTYAWEYWNGSAWVALSNVTDGTSGFSVDGSVRFDLPLFWATVSVNGSDALYYVRSRTTAFTSQTQVGLGTTILLARTIAGDSSQYGLALTRSGAGAYEDGIARTALDGTGNGRALEVSVELDTGSDGVIVGRGISIAACTWGIGLVGSVVAFIAGGAALTTLTPPNLDGSLKTYIISWSTEPNPGGSGATAMRSECLVQDVDGNSLTYTALTHAVTAEDPSDPFAVGGLWSGVALDNAFTDTINAVRVSGRFHTRAETREHFYAQTAAPDPDGIVCVEQPVWPDDAHVAGSIVGPQLQASALAMAIGQNRHRLAGPTIQVLTPSSPEYQPTLSSTTDLDATRCFTLSDTYKMHTGWTWRRKIPRQCEWVRVQVQIATWDTGAAAIAVNLRCYCSDKPPHLATEWSVQTLTRTANDTNGSGTGALLTFSPLFVRRDGEGRSFFWIASSLGTNDRVAIREISFAAMSMPDTDAMPPNQWGG